jgi:hypothetical protein
MKKRRSQAGVNLQTQQPTACNNGHAKECLQEAHEPERRQRSKSKQRHQNQEPPQQKKHHQVRQMENQKNEH